MNNDIEIFARIESGSQQALEELMGLYGKLVFHQAMMLLRNQADAEDAYQEVFIRVFRFAKSRKVTSAKAWLSKIAFNCSMDIISRRKKHQQVTDVLATTENTQQAAVEFSDNSFDEITAGCSSSEKEILTMRFVSHLSYNEISEATGMAEGTLRNLVSKLIKNLRQEVAK